MVLHSLLVCLCCKLLGGSNARKLLLDIYLGNAGIVLACKHCQGMTSGSGAVAGRKPTLVVMEELEKGVHAERIQQIGRRIALNVVSPRLGRGLLVLIGKVG